MRVPHTVALVVVLLLAGCSEEPTPQITPQPSQQAIIDSGTHALIGLGAAKTLKFAETGEVKKTRDLVPTPPNGSLDTERYFPDWHHNNELHAYKVAGTEGLVLWANHASPPAVSEVRAFQFTADRGGNERPLTFFCTGPHLKKGESLANFLSVWAKMLPGLSTTTGEYRFVNQPIGELQSLCVRLS